MNSGRPPVRIAHAYGNRRDELQQALAAPIDMIEADVWYRGGRLWVRHERRLGPLPLLMDSRMRAHRPGPLAIPIWPRHFARWDADPLSLAELLETARGKRPPLLDVKGRYAAAGDAAFAAALSRQVSEHSAQEEVAVCGQNWAVLKRLREIAPHLHVRYSIERPDQWQAFLRMIEGDEGARRVCIEHRFMAPDKARFLEDSGIDVYCWTVDDPAEAERLLAAGVDGIISNNLALLASLGSAPSPSPGRQP
ncbi:MAG: glycerophosphodiester phosphodiesterase [Chloroflexi bacterium]|nr:glycerophosphodiester phosphodiesterase [Chloroflexota bacterium]